MAKRNGINTAPAPSEKEPVVVHPERADKVTITCNEHGLRTYQIGDTDEVYEQVHPCGKKFLRRGDVFDMDALDAFRVRKLAADKKFPAVVRKRQKGD
ncbi:hypothetical protein UFOVP350_16 [uncultured Caudovirales phage]|uniref:Uncharacterized protein n=1 Tax=uncultured Caudovirales phage TaxID=2100421 RepID=A0A6J5LYC3_9CAUD|nr:hypothetical protein UFOVP350_16 [uncultured Caudovirales phage]